jgi:hypothetical protein
MPEVRRRRLTPPWSAHSPSIHFHVVYAKQNKSYGSPGRRNFGAGDAVFSDVDGWYAATLMERGYKVSIFAGGQFMRL